MADALVIPVSAPGLDQTDRGFSSLSTSATKATGAMTGTASAMSRLGQIASRGEFIRNASASFALLTMSSGNATEKLMSLTSALSAVPGPIGAVAAAGTLLLGVFNAISRSSEAAEKRVRELESALEGLESKRGAAMGQIAGRLGSSASMLGDDVRRFRAAGGSESERGQLALLTPGSPGAALRGASALATSGLDISERQRAIEVLRLGRRAGVEIDDKSISDAIATVKTAAENFKPLPAAESAKMWEARRTYAERGGGLFAGGGLRVINPPEDRRTITSDTLDFLGSQGVFTNREQAQDALNRSNNTRAIFAAENLRRAEAPALAEAESRFREASVGAMTEAGSASLRQAVMDNKGSLDELTATLKAINGDIAKTSQALDEARPKASRGWTWQFPWTESN